MADVKWDGYLDILVVCKVSRPKMINKEKTYFVIIMGFNLF